MTIGELILLVLYAFMWLWLRRVRDERDFYKESYHRTVKSLGVVLKEVERKSRADDRWRKPWSVAK